jgi:hypothetical protein
VLRIVRDGAVLEAGDPGVVDEHVEAAEPLADEAHDVLPVGCLAHVEVLVVRCRAEGRRKGAALRVPEVGEHHGRTLGGERVGNGGTDALRRASHQRNLRFQSIHAGCGGVFAAQRPS